jgi:hypothetical protein
VPIHALRDWREWLDVLADDGQLTLTPGRLLPASTGTAVIGAKAAGRQPKDDRRPVHHRFHPEERVAAARAKQEAFAAAGAALTAEGGQRHPQGLAHRTARGSRRRPPHHRSQFPPRWSSRPWPPATRPRRLPSAPCAAPPSTPIPWNQTATRSLDLAA